MGEPFGLASMAGPLFGAPPNTYPTPRLSRFARSSTLSKERVLASEVLILEPQARGQRPTRASAEHLHLNHYQEQWGTCANLNNFPSFLLDNFLDIIYLTFYKHSLSSALGPIKVVVHMFKSFPLGSTSLS
jgi:hypothetical protein